MREIMTRSVQGAPRLVRDRSHALGDRLILDMDVGDARIDRSRAVPPDRFTSCCRSSGLPANGRTTRADWEHVERSRAGYARSRLQLRGRVRRPLGPAAVIEIHRMLIVHRYPCPRNDMVDDVGLRHLGPERQTELGHPPVHACVRSAGRRRISCPTLCRRPLFRRAVGDGISCRLAFLDLVGRDVAGVEETEMRRIDIAFEAL